MPEFGEGLSEREMEVLRLAATGATNQQIARELYISVNTVKAHMRNIFTKLGVGSRTEASLYAIREGWISVDSSSDEQGLTTAPPEASSEDVAVQGEIPVEEIVPQPALARWPRWLAWAGFALLLLALFLSLTGLIPNPFSTPTATPNSPTPVPRWGRFADMPTPRSDLTLVSFQEFLYAIGGYVPNGVSDTLERLDSYNDTWTSLARKPTAVAEARGALLGGRIYVPGGRDAQGRPTDVTEAYDIERNRWVTVEALPRPLSNYALVSFEGKLYLFGGWDGESYRDEILKYDPAGEHWEQIDRLPFPWGHAGAAVASNRIFLLGGINEDGPIDVIMEYSPAFGASPPKPLTGASLGRVRVTSLGGFIHILSQVDDASAPHLWSYNIHTELWQEADPAPLGLYPGGAISSVGGQHILILGGMEEGQPLSLAQKYQALFIIVPVPAP